MGNVIHAADRFRQNYNQSPSQKAIWACIDERLALIRGLRLAYVRQNGDNVTVADFRALHSQHYHSTAGGAAGFGSDIHIAARMGRAPHLGKIDLSTAEAAGAVLFGQTQQGKTFGTEQPEKHDATMAQAYIQGSVGVKVARESNIHILNHVGCAAEDGTLAIGNGIAAGKGPQGEDIYEIIKDKRSRDGRGAPLPLSRFRQIQEIWAEALAEGTIASPDVSKPVHDHGTVTETGAELLPIARAPLIDIPHYAKNHLIEWGQDKIYDREAAFNASDFEGDGDIYGAYQTSMGSAMHLHDAVKSVFPVNSEDFLDAMYVRNAATSLWLPRLENEQVPVQLMTVGQ